MTTAGQCEAIYTRRKKGYHLICMPTNWDYLTTYNTRDSFCFHLAYTIHTADSQINSTCFGYLLFIGLGREGYMF